MSRPKYTFTYDRQTYWALVPADLATIYDFNPLFTAGVTGSGQTTKFLGGGQVGVNYEFYSGVVIGAEAMFDWLPNTTNTFNATEGPGGPVPGTLASATFNNRWLTTATGKLGYAWDRVLLYGKAGGAWVGAANPNLTVGGAGQTLSSNNDR